MKGMFFSFTTQSVSGQKLGEREGAMDTWWDHIVLPMGCEQDCVNACVIRTRWDIEDRPIGIVTVHRQSHAIEVPNRRLEDNEMQSSRRLFAVMVTALGGPAQSQQEADRWGMPWTPGPHTRSFFVASMSPDRPADNLGNVSRP
jgi:hypothetical protein